jgi:hypothetical protein
MPCQPGSVHIVFFPDQRCSARADNGGCRLRVSLEVKVKRGAGLTGSKVDLLPFYLMKGVSLVIEFDEVWHVNLIGIFPSVVTLRVSLPFDEILQGSEMSLVLVGMDLIHFVLLFPVKLPRAFYGST